MDSFKCITLPGRTRDGLVFVTIQYDGRQLSITGVVGPLSTGDATGSCGQCDSALVDDTFAVNSTGGWTPAMVARLYQVWNDWHLNDMRAGCEHQRAQKWTICPGHYASACPQCSGGRFVRCDSHGDHMVACKACNGVGLANPTYCTPDATVKRDPYNVRGTWYVSMPNSYRCTADRISEPCPECGYKFGSAWLFEEVPEDVLTFLRDLPDDTDAMPERWRR